METISRFNFGQIQGNLQRASWWSGLLHQSLPHMIDMPQPNQRGSAGRASAADDDWDHLWTDLGGEG